MIDVIMPTFNRVNALRRTIDSYMCQKGLNLFILVDDCSSDETPKFAEDLIFKYPGKVIYHRENKKTTTPYLRNIGIKLSKSELIFMGEDDVLLPDDHFEVLFKKMNELKADIIGGRRINLRAGQDNQEALVIANYDRNPIIVMVPFEQYYERFIEEPLEVPTLHSNVLIKREVFNTVQYDSSYDGNAFREETDFFLRAYDKGFRLWIVPNTIIYHLKNTILNSSGGSRKFRFFYEWQVWKNTSYFFIKNRDIFKKKFGVRFIYIYSIKCLIARYLYALKRRFDYIKYKYKYKKNKL